MELYDRVTASLGGLPPCYQVPLSEIATLGVRIIPGELEFRSDLAVALYIIANKTPNKTPNFEEEGTSWRSNALSPMLGTKRRRKDYRNTQSTELACPRRIGPAALGRYVSPLARRPRRARADRCRSS